MTSKFEKLREINEDIQNESFERSIEIVENFMKNNSPDSIAEDIFKELKIEIPDLFSKTK